MNQSECIQKGVFTIEKFIIKGDFLTLAQFLKELTYISSGGQAKWYLQDNDVFVNQEKETRRGKKLRAGDHVSVGENEYELVGELDF